MRSATRAGWLVVSWQMPWPSRICLVRWLAAARKDSGAGECEVLFQEVMLDLPRVIVAALISQFDLIQRVLVERQFVIRAPGAGQLQLVKNAKFHSAFPR